MLPADSHSPFTRPNYAPATGSHTALLSLWRRVGLEAGQGRPGRGKDWNASRRVLLGGVPLQAFVSRHVRRCHAEPHYPDLSSYRGQTSHNSPCVCVRERASRHLSPGRARSRVMNGCASRVHCNTPTKTNMLSTLWPLFASSRPPDFFSFCPSPPQIVNKSFPPGEQRLN